MQATGPLRGTGGPRSPKDPDPEHTRMSAVTETNSAGALALTQQRPRYGEKVVMGLLGLCGAVSVLTTVGIIFILFFDGAGFFRHQAVTVWNFLTGTEWVTSPAPTSEAFQAGVLPLVSATLVITFIGVLVAVPLGLATAVYLADFALPRVRKTIKPVLEVLAGVPTVVLGYFALTFVTPLLRGLFGQDTVGIFNMASAGLVMGVMIVPTVASLSEDAMSAVPHALRDAAYGLGATKRHVVLKVVFPAALSGIVSAIILAFGRAIGETMIVAIAAGNLPDLTFWPFEGAQTMTAYIVQVIGGEAPRGSVAYQSIFAVGSLLFLITFSLNLLAHRIARRYREVY